MLLPNKVTICGWSLRCTVTVVLLKGVSSCCLACMGRGAIARRPVEELTPPCACLLLSFSAVPRASDGMQEPSATTARPRRMLTQVVVVYVCEL